MAVISKYIRISILQISYRRRENFLQAVGVHFQALHLKIRIFLIGIFLLVKFDLFLISQKTTILT